MRIWLFVVSLGLALFVAVDASGSGPVARAAGASVDWPSYNNDIASNRYAASTQISKSTVAKLRVICTAPLGQLSRFQTGPVVVDGVLYATTATTTFALNAATCATLWVSKYSLTRASSAANRGAAVANGMVFRGFSDGHIVALNAKTGATLWNRNIVPSSSYEYVSAAPIVWNSIVIVGTANGDNGQMCHLAGLAASTGAVLWSDQLVPNLGQAEAKTWAGAKRIAGGATWTSFTVDPATGKLYVPVGNPGPDFDTRQRVGTNLYTNSILELNPATGSLLRALQLVPDDYHDWDQAATPAIVTLATGKKIVLSGGKDGYLRSTDLTTFAQVWKTPVTTFLNATAPITVSGTHYCPAGGIHWNGPSYSGSSGLAYVNSVDECRTVDLSKTPQPYVPGQAWLGTSNGYGALDATKTGWVTAVNAETGAVKWRYHSTTPMYAGITSTAGGVVFTADLNGVIYAFDDTTGALLKTIATGLPVGGGVISYEVSGTQYVAVAAGLSSEYLTPQTASEIVVLGT